MSYHPIKPPKDEEADPLKPSNHKTNEAFPKVQNSETMRRLVEMATPERSLMIVSAITMAIGSAVSLAVPSYAGQIIDLALGPVGDEEGDDDNSAFQLLMRLLGIMTLASIASFFRIVWQSQAGHRIVARLRRRLYIGILSQDAAYFDSVSQGDLLSRLSSDADLVQSAVTDLALGLLRNVVVGLGSIGLLFYTSASLALVSVAVLPPIAVCARMVGRKMRDRQKRVRELHADATSLAEQALTCIRTVQQFTAEPFESQQYNLAVNAAHSEAIQNSKLRAAFSGTMQMVVNLALLCVLGYGGNLVRHGDLSPGDLASFVMYSVMMGSNVSGISAQYIDLMKAVAAASRVFEVMDREPAVPPPLIVEPPENEVLVVPNKKKDKSIEIDQTQRMDTLEMVEFGETRENRSEDMILMPVTFQNVEFAYPTRPDAKILKGLNLSIQAGEVVAVVGGSGAGKSTIASLMTRLYDPQGGSVRLGEKALEEMEPHEVRNKIGIVVQEPLLFPTSIEANIRYGSPNATDEEVRRAAKLAFVTEFTDNFRDGLQTVVGPRGTQLSGGQKQRVAVARCILKNPPVVIFDEATSALDAESESQVQKAIDTACKGRTVIMIAHRLSTIRNADTVAVLRDGIVAERGSFDSLMKNPNGAFRQLMEKQLLA